MGKVIQRGKSFAIDISVNGKRVRRTFPTRKDAEEVLKKLTQHRTELLKKEIYEHTNTTDKNARRQESA